MLKIKDNLDLKELEKYGFEVGLFDFVKFYEFQEYQILIKIDKVDRILCIQNDYYDANYTCWIPNVVYDLIKADLVEKVSDE